VRALQAAVEAVRGAPAAEIYRRGTFDAGALARAGIPVAMFGCGGEGDWPAGDDFVAVSDVEDEARILATLILAEL
jgi:acetylornithine deacetylase/succinyl-diaminopimelate desuccinylase-like protein